MMTRVSESPGTRQMLADVVSGLGRSPKSLPCKYFYDDAGSRIFGEITRLPEYYPTRTELAIMRTHGDEIARAIGDGALLVEYGSGSSEKTRILLDAAENLAGYVPVDISGEYLDGIAAQLRADYPRLHVYPVAADFTGPFNIPTVPGSVRRNVLYFPGSTIGNFTRGEAVPLLRRMAAHAGRSGGVLIGVDLVKPLDRLLPAYDDSSGVTARFNLNLLVRLNRELGADFDVEGFRHEARFNADESRIEMYLRSRRCQTVQIDGHRFRFGEGEPLLTEYSHKYTLDSFAAMAAHAGLRAVHAWTDPDRLFSVQYLETAEAG